MGLTDSLGWETLQKSKDTATEWMAATATAQFKALKSGLWTLLVAAKSATVQASDAAQEAVGTAAAPLLNPFRAILDSAGSTRRDFLQTWPLSYRFSMLVVPLSVIVLTAPGLRPKAFRLVALGGPSSVLLTPEVNPFNRK